jgi:hypothetical protein
MHLVQILPVKLRFDAQAMFSIAAIGVPITFTTNGLKTRYNLDIRIECHESQQVNRSVP